jgi:phage terminase small subunit
VDQLDQVGLIVEEFRQRIGPTASDVDLEAFASQLARLRDARRRIEAEGMIVADPKGYPVPHPAIAIERAAQQEVRQWSARYPVKLAF